MVQTRATRSLAAGAQQATAARSFAQAFPPTKAGAASSTASKRPRTSSVKVEHNAQDAAQIVVRRGGSVRPAAPLKKEQAARAVNLTPSKTGKKKGSNVTTDGPATPPTLLADEDIRLCTTIERPELTFSVSDALDHLCAHDVRFEQLRDKIGLRTFTARSNKPLNLFQTLVTSILGQQISWLAARAILYKFTALFFPLPEKPNWDTLARDQLPFPTPRQVLQASDDSLRAAGLSFAKICYVRGLAELFGTGQMDVRQLIAMEDEQDLVRKLCEIKGVGVWTAQMCMIFALRRPNVLSHADLGIQKGMVLWYLAGPEGPTIRADTRKASEHRESLPKQEDDDAVNQALADASTQVRVDAVVSGDEPVDVAVVSGAVPARTSPSTPSLASAKTTTRSVPPIPADSGLTMRTLEERRKGKKIKGMCLTPTEMDSLARGWAPYQSIASIFMWSLVN